MSWIKSFPYKDLFVVALISFFLLGAVNLLFVYFSPSIIRTMPLDIVGNISPCYRTIFHHKDIQSNELEMVFGDSYSEGIGDEMIAGDAEYGIFNKLKPGVRSTFTFGRSGYGNLGTVVEYKRCKPLLDKFTTLELPEDKISTATFVFYEGNDLNNNLVELTHQADQRLYKISFFIPIFEYGYRKLREVLGREARQFGSDVVRSNINQGVKPTETKWGVQVSGYPQSAAIELNNEELSTSLQVLENSLQEIVTLLPAATNFQFLYVPSVASSYEFEGALKVQSYKGLTYFETSGEENRNRNIVLKGKVRHLAQQAGWQFCDTTEDIVRKSSEGVAVHGPVDWSHFNKEGYTVVADRYSECWPES